MSRYLQCFFASLQFATLQFQFVHPFMEKFHNLLRRARPPELTPETLDPLQHISKPCEHCQFESPLPHRFMVTLREDTLFHSIFQSMLTL